MQGISDIKSMGVILRSREKEREEGEKCTRYFFKKIMSKSGFISQLSNKTGQKVKNTKDIMQVVEDYYKELYDEKIVNVETITQTLDFIEKTVEDNGCLSQGFTLTELNQCQ